MVYFSSPQCVGLYRVSRILLFLTILLRISSCVHPFTHQQAYLKGKFLQVDLLGQCVWPLCILTAIAKLLFTDSVLIYTFHSHIWLCLLLHACLLHLWVSSPNLEKQLLCMSLSVTLYVQVLNFFFSWLWPVCSDPLSIFSIGLWSFCIWVVRISYILKKLSLCAICCNFSIVYYLPWEYAHGIFSIFHFFGQAENFYVIKFINTVVSFMALWI